MATGALIAAALVAGVADASTPLCRALRGLAEDVRMTGRSRSVTLFKLQALETACSRRTGDPLEVDYCDAAMKESGIEFSHRYPWLLAACLRADRIEPWVETRSEPTGLNQPKLVRLSADLRRRVKLDVRWIPSEGDNYYGRYELTLARSR